jgi:hypothetical protein
MSDDHVCVTNTLERVNRVDRPAPCRRRDTHYASCEDNDACRGCVPRSATHGELCIVCWRKVVDALSRVEDLIVHLRSIDKDAQAVGERVQTTMQKRLVVPDSWLVADDLLEALGAPPIPSTASIDEAFALAADAVNAWGDLEAIVSDREGAKRAVVLVKRMQLALKRWPDSEAHYRHVPYLLCPSCSQRTLWRRAPLELGDDLVVECSGSHLMYDEPGTRDWQGEVTRWRLGYPYCEWRMDWDEFALVYGPIFAALIEAEDRAAGRRKRPRIVLDTETPRTASAECTAGDHGDGCRATDCGCDCHLTRTYSLWSPKQSVDRLREIAAAEGRKSHV